MPASPAVAARPTHESWWGRLSVAASLLGLGTCVCLAIGLSLADRFPRQLDRYVPLAPGQASLYRATYADGSQGFLSTNVVRPGSESLAYAAIAGDGGKAIQVHSIFTNWQGTGETITRDDHFARAGNRLLLLAQDAPETTFTYDPPLLAWSPGLLGSNSAGPITGQTIVNGNPFTYRLWPDGKEGVTLPDGRASTALRLAFAWSLEGVVTAQSAAWYAPGIGLVRSEEYDGEGRLLLALELLNSTRLRGSVPALPLDELLPGGSQAMAFFREDAARTGAHPEATLPSANLKVISRFEGESGFTGSPTYASGVLYVADQAGKLLALDAQQGVPRWQFTAGGPVVAAPAVAGGHVYIGAGDKTLYALDAQHGLYLWSFRLRDNVSTSPVVVAGTVFVGGEDRTLYALDPSSGRVRWTFAAGARLVSSPAVSQGRVFFGSDDSLVYALDATTGNLLWRRALDAPVEATVAVSPDGVVYAASTGEQLAAIEAASGQVLWTAEARFGYLASPVVGDDRVFAADTGGVVRALDRRSGELAWEWRDDQGASFVSSPLLLGRLLLAADVGGVLHVLDASRGQELHRVTVGGSVTASPTWGADTIFIANHDGEVLALRP